MSQWNLKGVMVASTAFVLRVDNIDVFEREPYVRARAVELSDPIARCMQYLQG
jgi:hypothetical protein